MSKAIKNDQDKLRYDLIPPEVEEAMARAMTDGAKKYPARNWEEGFDWMRIYASLRRHLAFWVSRRNTDEDSGLQHLDHVAACVAMLVATVERGIGSDDRPGKPRESLLCVCGHGVDKHELSENKAQCRECKCRFYQEAKHGSR